MPAADVAPINAPSDNAKPQAMKRARKTKEALVHTPIAERLESQVVADKDTMEDEEAPKPRPTAQPQAAQMQTLQELLVENPAEISDSAGYPAGIGTRGSRAGSKGVIGAASSDRAVAPSIGLEEDAATIVTGAASADQRTGTVDGHSAPPAPQKRRARASAQFSEPMLAMDAAESEAEPNSATSPQIQTKALISAVRRAARLTPRNPTRALAELRSALARYPQASPTKRARAHRQAALILEQLGRGAEAKEEKKKANELDSAN
jgi:hypothetical protein